MPSGITELINTPTVSVTEFQNKIPHRAIHPNSFAKHGKSSFMSCLQRSQIGSDWVLAIPGKALPGCPIVIDRKKHCTHPSGDGDLCHTAFPQEAAKVHWMLSSLWLALIWAMGGYNLDLPLHVTWEAQVQTTCLLSLGQSHCFTSCSITPSSYHLTLHLHCMTWFLINYIVKFKHTGSFLL